MASKITVTTGKDTKKSIIESLSTITAADLSLKLNSREKDYLDQVRLADEKAKHTSFTLGGPIKHKA